MGGSGRWIDFVVSRIHPYDAECLMPPSGETVSPFSVSLLLLALLVPGSVSSALAVDRTSLGRVEIEAVGDGGTLKLGDDQSLCLAGIWVPGGPSSEGVSAGWPSAWRKIIRDGGFGYPVDGLPRHDRYGCALADIENDEGRSLADTLLEAGWASVDPTSAPEDPAVIDAMLAFENLARRARRGLWKDVTFRPKAAGSLADWIGTRQLVEGRVHRVSENDRYLYLNFGADWRTDFTTRLDRKMMKPGGFEAADYDGKKLRVRGVVVESRGPLIDIVHLKQIEFLP